MKMKPFGLDPRRGSALLASMIVVTVLSFAAAGILSYSLNTYENSVRQALLDQAREVADSEMEYLYFGWKNVLMSRAIAIDNVDTSTPMAAYLTAGGAPSLKALQVSTGPQWSVTRAIKFQFVGQPTGDGSAEGVVNGNLIGKNYYFNAWTSATYTSAVLGTVTFRTGRHFAYSSTPLFQYAVFYQGNLELAPGGNMVVNGPISTNASAYLGSHPGYALTLTDQVAYFQDYNGAADPLSGETQLLEGSSTLSDPIYNPNPGSAQPIQTTQRQIQVTKLQTQASFIGGVSVQADMDKSVVGGVYHDAYSNLSGVADPNEIYRAVIAPPPLVPGTSTLAAEDPVVAASRMYNTAGMLVTINQDPSTGLSVHVGNSTNTAAYDADFPTIVHPGDGHVGDPAVLQQARTQILDPREYANGNTGVNMTTLDVGNLKTQLALAMVADPTLTSKYNGVVYIYDSSDNSALTPSIPADANSLNAIRIKNGASTPDYRDANNNPLGFTVVSNNGVYVQGDYNTTQITVPGVAVPVNNPTAIMGDAVTALSTGWDISKQRTDTNTFASIVAISNREPSLPAGDNDVMTINSAILTGNTPSAGTGANPLTDYNSGGAQNLVRMIEDWFPPQASDGNPLTLKLDGSLGQLFTSKYFTGHYTSNANLPIFGVDGGGHPINPVYTQPPTRDFDYDTGFKDRAPAGAPTTTGFTRGDFFFW
jgi:hypothetical protein